MRIGFFLPQMGPAADVAAIVKVAKDAEDLNYDSLWATERLLYPVNPQTLYRGGPFPEAYKRVFDPLEALVFASAHTSRIALGTSVLDIPFYNPVLLARRLTSFDVLSGGRSRVGFGLGWSKDEYDATGAVMKVRGRRAEEFLKVLKAIWTTDPVEFHGRYFQLPKSIIQPKPVQKPHPPIYLAGSAQDALKRVARLADGWMPVGLPVDQLRSTVDEVRRLAQAAGRDPKSISVVARYNIMVYDQPQGKERRPFSGTLDQIREDIEAIKAYGPDELIIDPTHSPDSQTAEGYIKNLGEIRRMV
jgi:probable F420-dependent oxidoreductase